jgi:acyl-CoA reductase-like NAD-dependent aldehyde dehydrogenase
MAPANYPLLLPGVQTLQALVAGNAVLLKPGAGGLTVAGAFVQHLEHAGLDRRLVQVLSEAPAAAQTAIASGVDKVLLTGSAATGAAVLTLLAPHLTPAVLELSGCDAAFVRADADLDLVVRALTFSLRLNGGATCIAPRRVFVARPLAADLETRLLHAVQAMAPCAVAPAVTALVRELVAEACAQGARQLAGDFLPDHAMTPVLMADTTPVMRLLQTDVFAPVLALIPVHDDDEALAAAAPCPYALGATVFGQEQAARTLAQRVRAGVVLVNDVIVPTADPRLPFGGRGRSGFGVTRGAAGLLELTCLKAVAIRRGRWRPHYAPPLPQDEALFRAYMTAAHGASWRERLVASLICLRALGRRLWR